MFVWAQKHAAHGSFQNIQSGAVDRIVLSDGLLWAEAAHEPFQRVMSLRTKPNTKIEIQKKNTKRNQYTSDTEYWHMVLFLKSGNIVLMIVKTQFPRLGIKPAGFSLATIHLSMMIVLIGTNCIWHNDQKPYCYIHLEQCCLWVWLTVTLIKWKSTYENDNISSAGVIQKSALEQAIWQKFTSHNYDLPD